MRRLNHVMSRLGRLPCSETELGLDRELLLLQLAADRGKVDRPIVELVEDRLTNIEDRLRQSAFLEPPPILAEGLALGDIEAVLTASAQPVRVSLRSQETENNAITHIAVPGQTKTGKSCLQAQIAAEAAASCHTLVIDTNGFFRNVKKVRDTHEFLDIAHLRLGLFDPIPGVPGVDDYLLDQVMIHEIVESYSLQFAEYVIIEVLQGLREDGISPNLPLLLEKLKTARYQGFSRRSQYRDSAVLVLNNLLHATGDLFRCARGMDIKEVLSGNRVLEIGSLLPKHQACFLRLLFSRLQLMASAGHRLDKPLLVSLDEGQVTGQQENFSEKELQLRHAGIHFSINVQNASKLPVELLGNADALFFFQCTDERDKRVCRDAAGMTPEQADELSRLEPGTCVCYLPRTGWKRPFIGIVPRLDFTTPDKRVLREWSEGMLQRFEWIPLGSKAAGPSPPPELGEQEERFLRDVANAAHEFSKLTPRFERSGIRSASAQARLIKKLVAGGYLRLWEVSVGKGRPIKLCELTPKSAERLGVDWKESNQDLPTRFAKQAIDTKMRGLLGWQVQTEGGLTDRGGRAKKVDILCRDPFNKVVAIEIAGASADHEVHNALFNLRCEEVRKHVVVAVSKPVLAEAKKKLAEIPELAGSDRLELLTLARALGDWVP